MKIKRFTLVQQVLGILLIGFTIIFAAGSSVMRGLQQANLKYIYEQTQELVRTSIDSSQEQLSDVRQTLYNLIVSDAVQEAGSQYLQLQSRDNSLSAQSAVLDTITAVIQKGIIDNSLITCANYLDLHGNVRAVASTGYVKLGNEAARLITQRAVEAKGVTIMIDGKAVGIGDHDLIFIKELREKKDLSMKHIGVIVLFADMEKIGQALVRAYHGSYRLQNSQASLLYLFNDPGKIMQNEDAFSWADIDGQGYALLEIGGGHYFATEFSSQNYIFTYRVLLPYRNLFARVEQLFQRFIGIFVLCCLGALILSALLMRSATMDIHRLRSHIHNITDIANIQPCQNLPMHNRDSCELYKTFNSMAEHISRLIRDNYQKQILVKETQLATLQAQINPHFLYNTLNSIYWMAKKTDNPDLAVMVDSLSRLLREATNISETLIDIDRELEIVCHYARIQKQRYPKRLKLTFDVAEACSGFAIPKFTLQPMLENAIQYGLECMLEPCDISICIFAQEDDCVCQVRNKGPAPVDNLMEKLKKGKVRLNGNGIGLLNIDRRIKTVFGEQYGVVILRDQDKEETIVEARFQQKLLE